MQVYANRFYLCNPILGQMLQKLESKSAFNSSLGLYLLVQFICLHLDNMLMTATESIPELLQFAYSSFLFCRDQAIESAEGVQQRDRLDLLLFCMTIQPMLQELKSELKFFYLDDGTLWMVWHGAVLCELQWLKKEDLGLQLNRSKSKLCTLWEPNHKGSDAEGCPWPLDDWLVWTKSK